MKTVLAATLGFLMITISTPSLAWSYGSSCSQGGCGGDCDFMQSSCQCTDPMCNNPAYSNCMDRARCCEAFGNIGAR